MIGRIWKGRIRSRDLDAYRDYMQRTGLADYRATPGNCGAYLLARADGDVTYIATLSFWDRLESIRAFAGDAVERARYYPEDEHYLLDFPVNVEHFDVTQV